eukprot:scaffold20344_cov26-Prasinocladus_malaysianus.AAC.1
MKRDAIQRVAIIAVSGAQHPGLVTRSFEILSLFKSVQRHPLSDCQQLLMAALRPTQWTRGNGCPFMPAFCHKGGHFQFASLTKSCRRCKTQIWKVHLVMICPAGLTDRLLDSVLRAGGLQTAPQS